MRFVDRTAAGRRLAEEVERMDLVDPVVLGLPRGGIPVAYEVARALAAPLDVIAVRKLGVPYQPELGFGAIGEEGVRIMNDDVVRAARVGARERAAVEEDARAALELRLRRYRGDRPPVGLRGRTAVIVDDGIATGSTASAACRVARARGAARVVLAVPLAPSQALAWLRQEADDVVCLSSPEYFGSVGQWYVDFAQTGDDEVAALLARGAMPEDGGTVRTSAASGMGTGTGTSRGPGRGTGTGPGTGTGLGTGTGMADPEVVVSAGPARLPGNLVLPDGTPGIVVFAHGSGSSRHSPRNQAVATALNRAGLGTLLFDLLTPDEAMNRTNVFDIGLLAERLTLTTQWLLREHPLPVCYFGASTGAAAALMSAAEPHMDIAAVVSRGGRPDLAAGRLAEVRAPTLLIVGGADTEVLRLNRQAADRLRCEYGVAVVPGATHLFEEPGALEAVAELAAEWFAGHLFPYGAALGPHPGRER
ncbi:phosphoribosyltransferase [Streptomyces sp. GMY02]|uniref:phosphoribosyltransferase family protein n=1 Tax=Streptomyces sp. GMY02 TaxID=1333528 RepID=UPI001C2C8543|nr:phosphoribosyltransferase family protein [Streptomyces sp. GMY02]QXE34073.1 phosphoribosyltransferase [Streptomyces sp. GMY02]